MKFKTLAIIALTLTSLLAACGGNGEDQNTFTVTATDDFTYSPDTITVKADQEVNLIFNNEGSVEHSLNILKGDEELEHVLEAAHDEEALHEELLLEVHEIGSGAEESVTFTAPSEPGDYAFFCSIPGHADAGLVGTLTVTS